MKRKFRISLFSGIVLVVALAALLGVHKRKGDFLFDSDSKMTLYVQTMVGIKPEFKAQVYFADEEVEYTKISYDLENCDWNQAGTYEIPVYYDGKITNCTIELNVVSEEF